MPAQRAAAHRPIDATTTTRWARASTASARPSSRAVRITCSTCRRLVNSTKSTPSIASRDTASRKGRISAGSAQRYSGTRNTCAPRASSSAISCSLVTPYSNTATRRSRTEPFASSEERISRQVLGSGTLICGVRPSLRSSATGLGPGATSVARRSDAARRSDEQRSASVSASVRTPTSVIITTMSTSPASSPRSSSSATRLSSSGTSRVDGTTSGTPPLRRIRRSSSTARRLSNAITASPPMPPPDARILIQRVSRESRAPAGGGQDAAHSTSPGWAKRGLALDEGA